jgi:uncharacterized protein
MSSFGKITGAAVVAVAMAWSGHGLRAQPAAEQARAPNPAADIETLKQQAEKGDPEAQWQLGAKYVRGNGVVQDNAIAVRWFSKAAEQGEAKAQVILGAMYATGRGVAQNNATAVSWYSKAAEQGDASAQYNLGFKYANGRGVAQNYVAAHKWWNLVSANAASDEMHLQKKQRKCGTRWQLE